MEWGLKNSVDFIAASFVSSGEDVEYIRSVMLGLHPKSSPLSLPFSSFFFLFVVVCCSLKLSCPFYFLFLCTAASTRT